MQNKIGMTTFLRAAQLIAHKINKTVSSSHSNYSMKKDQLIIIQYQQVKYKDCQQKILQKLINSSQLLVKNNAKLHFKVIQLCKKKILILILICMKSLFIRSLSRLLNSCQVSAPKNSKIQTIQHDLLGKFNETFKVKDLQRLTPKEMKIMLKVPCPSQNFDRSQIMIFKRLRNTYHIKQENVCSRCPRANKCPFKNQEAQQKNQAKLQHILFFLIKLQQMDYSTLRWSSAYKVAQNLRIMIKDSSNLKVQSALYRQAQKYQEQKEKSKVKQKKDAKSKKNKSIYENRRFHLTNQ